MSANILIFIVPTFTIIVILAIIIIELGLHHILSTLLSQEVHMNSIKEDII